MSLFSRSIKINPATFIVFGLLLMSIVLMIYLFKIEDPKWQSIVSGLATGFALASVQLLLSWQEYSKLNKYAQMKIINIREDRDDRKMYEGLIKKAKTEITILGVTANRLINDFADETSGKEESKVLIRALSRGVRVKILLPELTYLLGDKDKQVFSSVKESFKDLNNRFSNFEYKYFNHAPSHSIFLVDNECILGPVFPGVSSKNTPSIHVEKSSPFATTYLSFFQNEWNAQNS